MILGWLSFFAISLLLYTTLMMHVNYASLSRNSLREEERLVSAMVDTKSSAIIEDLQQNTISTNNRGHNSSEIDFQHKRPATGLKPNTPVCHPSFLSSNGHRKTNIKTIYFAHVRKAGGTTLRTYLASVAEVYNIQFKFREAGKFDDPTRSDTLYVSHLREPIARLISNYKYEYRWDCEKQLLQDDFQPTQENIVINLTSWIRKEHLQNTCKTNLWKCSTNCNVKMFEHKQGNVKCRKPLSDTTKDEIYKTAIEKISGYNLVVDVERLFKSVDYGRSIESYFGVNGLVGLQEEMYCGAEAKKANKLIPLVVENETLEEMKEINSIDDTFFKSVTTCKNNKVRFPTESLKEYIKE